MLPRHEVRFESRCPSYRSPLPRYKQGTPGGVLLLLGALGTLVPRAAAQTPPAWPDPESWPRPVAEAIRTDRAPVIDGVLEPEVWEAAPMIDQFIQAQPIAGAPAEQRTEVRIVYDGEGLYISAVCHQSAPLVVRTLERDFPGASTRDIDVFSVTLDTFLDRRNSFIWLINPYGAFRDGQSFDDSRVLDFGWDGVAEVRTSFFEGGWIMEMRIPWSTLRFNATLGPQDWGLNFGRRTRSTNEDAYWAPVDRRDPVHRMSKAGTLRGLRDLPAAGNRSVKPYLLGEQLKGPGISGTTPTRFDAGGDLKWGITPGLTLDLTVRTDFSQVEVDAERVNLTRFPLFFEEQRDFFLENSGVFRFGDVAERNYRLGAGPRDFSLFQSRRIGLAGGEVIPILGGGRLTGSVGPVDLGVLAMRTEGAEGRPAETFTVARVRRDILSGSDVGFLLASRDPDGDDEGSGENRSWGLDTNLRFGGVVVNGYLAGSDTPASSEEAHAGRVSIAYRDRNWNVSALWKDVGRDFSPGIGFVRRTDVRQLYGTVGILRRPDAWGPVLEVAPYVEVDLFSDRDGGGLQSRDVIAGLDLELRSGAGFSGRWADRIERIDRPFSAGGGVDVGIGEYAFREGELSWTTDAASRLAGSVRAGGGGFYGGTRHSLGVEANLQANYRLSADLSLDWNGLELPGADPFTSSVYRVRIKYSFNASLFTTGYLQFNDAADQWVTNVRLNWIHAPLSHVYLVFLERRDAGTGRIEERVLTAKFTRFLSF